MTKRKTLRSVRALTVAATAAATALVGIIPAAALAGSGSDTDRAPRRGYVCDRLERDESAAVGSSRCRAFNAPRHGTIRGDFVIETRDKRLRVLCKARPGRASGYANTPNWVRGENCRRA
ncbi:hypothetical protein [Streptomyces albus]|uniref:hypothetical protein n=1 Tax=Streptomyces TaxID=1883 RepID=UPI0004BDBF11|nr:MULTISPECIES: hypothetical protein [Streptomyces]KPC96391.1 hypothetical protein ADL27_03945 [Streptomyces sp. NRRL F-6602]MDI6409967.1 hypothetical protein [Streptomyces albus]